MRRGLILLVCSVILPAWLGVAPVAAQLQMNTYPSGILNQVNTTVTVGNTLTGTALYSFSVPARIFQQFRQSQMGASALHLRMLGNITTNTSGGQVGTVNVGCSYGGTTASITLVNGAIPTNALSSMPLTLDLWVRRQGTGTASQLVQGQLYIANVTGSAATAPSLYDARVIGTTSMVANQTLTCLWAWSSASTTNTMSINSAVLSIGE